MLLPALLFLLSVHAVSGSLVSAYERTLLHAKDKANPSGSVIDPGQNRMVNFDGGTVYTRADADGLAALAKGYMLSQYGLDFFNAPAGPVAKSWALPQGIMYPFANGDDFLYRLVFDTKNLGVGVLDKTFIFDVGFLTIMSQDGNFTGGVMNGTSYKRNDILCYTRYNYLEEYQRGPFPWPGKGKNTIDIRCNVPAIQYLNSQGFTDQFIDAEIVDKQNRVGHASITTKTTRVNGVPYQRVRSFLTFNETA